MTWDTGTWYSGFWDQPASTYFQTKPKHQQTNMRRQVYFPGRITDQVAWLSNYYTKLPIHGPTCNVIAVDVTASVADAKWCHYVLDVWLSAVRAFAPSTTDAVDDVLTGEGLVAIVLPTFVPPTLPAGVTAELPGALTRIFTLVAKMKLEAACVESIQTDMGIVGAEETPKAAPKFLIELMQGMGQQTAKLTFYKYGHEAVYIESRRGGPSAAWDFLGIDSASPYEDARPLLVAGQPEVREYRMRFWDKGTPNGDWTDVQKETVSP